MAQKPSIPKGTRDFNPQQVQQRNYIIASIRKHFELFGFMPIETPSMENSSTLMGKYGEEGDRLIFKILNSGAYLSKASSENLIQGAENSLTSEISKRALRYDLTVPFARFVVQHRNEINFPFKRYQIQNVWRADRPQKGRYCEFTQCDADVVGSNSLLQEVDFIKLFDAVYTDLGLKGCTIKINNRKILAGIAEVMGAQEQLIPFTVALDKLDKIGRAKVEEEMMNAGISTDAIAQLSPVFEMNGTYAEKLEQMKNLLSDSEVGMKGVAELEFIQERIAGYDLQAAALDLDITLARGLNYYTGCIFEVSAPETVSVGSIAGGGRYDDLTGIFGMPDTSGVGISFGLDRMYLVMDELELFPKSVRAGVDVMVVNFGEREALSGLEIVDRFRESGIKAELFPDAAKMKKQMNYADKNQIPFVVIAGENEIKDQVVSIKTMSTGEQDKVSMNEIVAHIKARL